VLLGAALISLRQGTAPKPKARSKSTRKDVEASAEATGLAPLRYRQFRGVAWPPSRPPPQSTGTAPASKLVLHHVHGYRGVDCRDNLWFTGDGELLYFVAAVGVVADFDRNTQRFFTGHDDDIVSLALHPDGRTVATGQIGRHASVCIWDSRTGRLITKLQKVAERRVACLSFSPDGARLIVVGGDDHHTIKVLDWRRATISVITEARGHGNDVLALQYNPYIDPSGSMGGPEIVQCGAKHLKFWATAKGGSLTTVTPSSSKTGPKAKLSQHFLCVAFFPDASSVVGAASGAILQFRGQELASVLPNAHKGFVSALRVLPDGGSLCSAGKDGQVIVWGGSGGVANLEPVVEMDLADVLRRPGVYGRAITANDTGDVLAVGTSRNDIVCFDRREGTLKTVVVTQGHSADVSGLALDSASPSFATCADDKTLRLWCLRRGSLLGISQLPVAGRACAISPHGDTIVVGLSSGGLQAHDADSLRVKYENPQLAKEAISDLKFSPDGQTLAVASHDNMIYLLDAEGGGWRQFAVLQGHSSYVSHVDWSEDGQYLQSTDGANELLYWDADGRRMPTATDFRDTEWASWTCPFGWPVAGIWPPNSDGTDVNSVDRSPQGTVLATGDDSSKVRCAGAALLLLLLLPPLLLLPLLLPPLLLLLPPPLLLLLLLLLAVSSAAPAPSHPAVELSSYVATTVGWVSTRRGDGC
jgi:WD40 repeat protein